MSIDIHAHCVPASAAQVLASEGAKLGIEVDAHRRVRVAGRELALPLREDLIDRDARLREMDRAGIDVQIFSTWIDLSAYALAPEQGARWARLLNTALAEEAASRADRFRALASVPLQDPEAAADELRYAIGSLGMAGVEIATNVAGARLSDAALEPFWSAAAALGCLVLLHPVDALRGIDLRAHFLENLVGRPAESTIATADLMLAGVLERHPDLQICVVHGGGFLPYQIGRLQRGWTAKPGLVAADTTLPPLDALRRLHFDTVLHEPAAIRYLIDLVGVDRVLLGTDYPFEMGDPDPLSTIDRVPRLTEEERSAIVSDNAGRLIDRAGST